MHKGTDISCEGLSNPAISCLSFPLKEKMSCSGSWGKEIGILVEPNLAYFKYMTVECWAL